MFEPTLQICDQMSTHDLTRPQLHILLALADQDRHGYGIMLEVGHRSGGIYRLWPATLYGALKRMVAKGLVEYADTPSADDDDPRRQYYSLTDTGRAELSREVGRMQNLVRVARAKRVKPAAQEA